MPNCKSCGAEITGAQKFCGVCGAPVVAQPAAAPAPAGNFQRPPMPQAAQGQKKSNKKIIIPVVCVLLAAAIGVGGWFVYTNIIQGGEDSVEQGEPPDADAPAHESLFFESDTMLGYARQADDSGVTLQAEYTYGLALAPVSAFRLCVDNILWLMGEGEAVEDIIGAAPYGDWNEVVAVGLGSPMPFYFEGLLYQIQGMDAEAEGCYAKARANPLYTEQDYYYLRNMSVEDLYALRNAAVEKELAILDEYTPRPVLYAERTGAEFSPAYHAALAGEKLQGDDSAAAYGCFLNAVLCYPQIPDYYAATVLLGLQTGQTETALYLLNEGLWAHPQNGELNYAAATVAYADGDTDNARAYLQAAKADTELPSEFAAECDRLAAQMGG